MGEDKFAYRPRDALKMRAMKPILLLGKDGQVGWELRRALAPLGTLIACGRAECDIGNFDVLRALIRETAPRLIVNAAGYTAVDRAETDRDAAFRANADAPGVMAEEAVRAGIPLIHYSTDYVFDGEKAEPYDEDDATAPQSVYGESKLAGEQAIARSGAAAAIFRTSWVFGGHGGNFVRTILRLAGERSSLRVVADQVGAPTPAQLIADVTAHAVATFQRERWPGRAEIFHLAAAHPVSWHQFARAVVGAAGRMGRTLILKEEAIEAIPTEAYPLPAKRPRNSRLRCSRLEKRFGLTMPGWEPYLEQTLACWLAQG